MADPEVQERLKKLAQSGRIGESHLLEGQFGNSVTNKCVSRVRKLASTYLRRIDDDDDIGETTPCTRLANHCDAL